MMGPIDLKIFDFYYMGPCIGMGFNVSTPVHQLKYDNPTEWRCLSFIAFCCGIHLSLTIPLFKEPVAERNNANAEDKK